MSAGALPGRDGSESAPRVPAGAPNPGDARPDTTVPAAFSPTALRLLGVRTPSAARAAAVHAAIQRHEVVLGDYEVQAVLAEAPASNREGRSPEGQTWVASTPYLVWTPLPSDVPSSGLAFACVGAGYGGWLFIDLAAAPGAVMLGASPRSPAGWPNRSPINCARARPRTASIWSWWVTPCLLPSPQGRSASPAPETWGGAGGQAPVSKLNWCSVG
jgi:hypothetical protein